MITHLYVGQTVEFKNPCTGLFFGHRYYTIKGFSGIDKNFVSLEETTQTHLEAWLVPVIRTGPGLINGHISGHVQRHPTVPGAWVHA